MAHRVYFSFSYQDLWRANVVRNSAQLDGFALAGFHDASVWEKTKTLGDSAVRGLIDSGLDKTIATIVLIGSQTAARQWVDYEIERSLVLRHAVIGVRINRIRDQYGRMSTAGPVPSTLLRAKVPVHDYEFNKLGQWIDNALGKIQP